MLLVVWREMENYGMFSWLALEYSDSQQNTNSNPAVGVHRNLLAPKAMKSHQRIAKIFSARASNERSSEIDQPTRQPERQAGRRQARLRGREKGTRTSQVIRMNAENDFIKILRLPNKWNFRVHLLVQKWKDIPSSSFSAGISRFEAMLPNQIDPFKFYRIN